MTTPVDLDRLDAVSRCLTDDPPGYWCPGCKKIATRCGCAELLADAYPALSAELRALRAEVGDLRQDASDRGFSMMQQRLDEQDAELSALRAENERLRAAVTRVVNVADRRGKWIDDLSDEVSELRRLAAKNIDAAKDGA